MTTGIEGYLKDVCMQVVKHRVNALGKKGKRKIGSLTEEYVHYCEAEHKVILEKYGAEEGLAESLMKFWEISAQQENMLIRNSKGDKNFNVFEINALYVTAGLTCNEPCEVVPEVKEEEGEYPCTLDMDQIPKFVSELKNEMTWSRRDKSERTLAYLDSGVTDRLGNKSIMTQEEIILSQRGDQHRNEFVVAELATEDKGNFSKFRNYDEELEKLED